MNNRRKFILAFDALSGLRDLGYLDGKNILFELRMAEGKLEVLPGLAQKLVRSKTDIIVAVQTPAPWHQGAAVDSAAHRQVDRMSRKAFIA